MMMILTGIVQLLMLVLKAVMLVGYGFCLSIGFFLGTMTVTKIISEKVTKKEDTTPSFNNLKN